MTSKQLGWLLGGSLMLVAASGCEVSTCKDGEDCDIDFDESFDEDDGGSLDGGDTDGGTKLDGGGDAGDGGTDAGDDMLPRGEPLTLIALCERLNDRYLQWSTLMEGCCTNADFISADSVNLRRLFGSETFADGCLNFYKPLVDSGKVVYSDSFGGDCAADFLANFDAPPASCPAAGFNATTAITTVGHGAPALAQIASCRSAMAGTVSADSECTSDFECKDRLVCRPGAGGGAGTINTCQAAVPEGGICSLKQDGQCAAGLTCLGQMPSNPSTDTGICRASLNETNCSRTKECVEGKFCDVGTQADPGSFQCTVPPAGVPICTQN